MRMVSDGDVMASVWVMSLVLSQLAALENHSIPIAGELDRTHAGERFFPAKP
jgi:hypothetical protein